MGRWGVEGGRWGVGDLVENGRVFVKLNSMGKLGEENRGIGQDKSRNIPRNLPHPWGGGWGRD